MRAPRLRLLFALIIILNAPPSRGADFPSEPAPSAVHLVGHEDAALLNRVQQLIDDWDPRKLRNPYVETVAPADPSTGFVQKIIRRSDLTEFIRDANAAEALGKAFFWEMQAGSDFRRVGGKYIGTACASCHYRFGADARDTHTTRIPYTAWEKYKLDKENHPLEHGEKPLPYPPEQKAVEVIKNVADFYLPLAQRPRPRRHLGERADREEADEEDEEVNDEEDNGPRTRLSLVVGSQGVEPRRFESLVYGNKPEQGGDWSSEIFTDRLISPFEHFTPDWAMFIQGHVDKGRAFRQITPRNTPTTINATFSDRLFHDGRAESTFNGFSIFGDLDPRDVIHVRRSDGKIVPIRVAISKAALASQAVGPIVNDLEMSYTGRTFHDVAFKLLDAPILGYQDVADTDSHLGWLKKDGKLGAGSTYRELIKRAFRSEWWDGSDGNQEQAVPLRLIEPKTNASLPHGTLMEANFSLYWGLSIMLYEASLVSNDSPFDQMMRGNDKGVESAWTRHKSRLEPIYIDRIHADKPGEIQVPRFPFKSGAEVFQRGFRVFMSKGCIDCHAGPLLSELYSREDAMEPKPAIGETLNRTLLPNSQGDAIAIKLKRAYNRVFNDIVAELMRHQPAPSNLAAAKRLALELEQVREQARGSEDQLTRLIKARLTAAGLSENSAPEVAKKWIAFEKLAPTHAGNRIFFNEEERVKAAALLVDPVFVESMPIPPNQVKHRRPLPIEPPLAKDPYAFYDLAFYALGAGLPRYDRGNGDFVAIPQATIGDLDHAIDEVVASPPPPTIHAPASFITHFQLRDRFKKLRESGKLKLLKDDVKTTVKKGQRKIQDFSLDESAAFLTAVKKKIVDRVKKRHKSAQSQAASGTPGAAYRIPTQVVPGNLIERTTSPTTTETGSPAHITPHQPNDKINRLAEDPDVEFHDDKPYDLSWYRDFPFWDDLISEKPKDTDSIDKRRSNVLFFSRARTLVQNEQSWGFRKPFLHDNELAFWGAFKTPTLRNVELTAPYMHNGRLMTLMDVVDFYDRGGDVPASQAYNPDKHPEIVRIHLNAEDKLSLVFFLLCLTDERVQCEKAPFDHPSIRIANGYKDDFTDKVIDLEAIGSAGLPAGKCRSSFPSDH